MVLKGWCKCGIKKRRLKSVFFVLEAGLEPARPQWPLDFKSNVSTNSTTSAWYVFKKSQSERRDLNPRPSPWQGDALPLSYFRTIQ